MYQAYSKYNSHRTTSTRGIFYNEEYNSITHKAWNNSILERDELHALTMLKFSRGPRVMNNNHLINFADESDCIICQETVRQGFACNNCAVII